MNLRAFLSLLMAFSVNACLRPVAPDHCGENPGKDSLLIFVGQKISVDELAPGPGSIDVKFVARYRILERMCGNYTKDTIEFVAYDHYGRPAFEKFETVLLYVAKWDSGYYHLKYQFDPLFKTRGGQWASPFLSFQHSRTDTIDPSRRITPIDFAEDVSFPTNGMKKQEVRHDYPKEFYRIENGRAIATYGFYIPQLLAMKKNGVLKYRGYFGESESNKPVVVQDVELEEIVSEAEAARRESILFSPHERKQLIVTWRQLLTAIDQGNTDSIRSRSLDSVLCAVCEGFGSPTYYNEPEPIDSFTRYAKLYIPGSTVDTIIHKGHYTVSAKRYPGGQPPHYNFLPGESRILYSITFHGKMIYNGNRYGQSIRFQFVKEQGRFRFYGMEME